MRLILPFIVLPLLAQACGNGSAENAQPAQLNGQGTTSADSHPTGTSSGGGTASSSGGTGGTGGTATLQGTVAGYGFVPQSAIFATVTDSTGTAQLQVKLSDQPDDCTLVSENIHRAGANALWLRAVGGPFPGTFQLQASGGSSATFYSLNKSCVTALPDSQSGAVSGTLTLTSAGITASGTFSATMGQQGDAVSGTFTATTCPALATLINSPDSMQRCQSSP